MENITGLDDRGKRIIKHCQTLPKTVFARVILIRLIKLKVAEVRVRSIQKIANDESMLRSRDSVNAKRIPFFLVAYYLPRLLMLETMRRR